MATARPKSADPGWVGEILDCLEQGASVRRELPGGGRVHIDRPLPFLCLHATGDGHQLAALDVATANASYLIAPRRSCRRAAYRWPRPSDAAEVRRVHGHRSRGTRRGPAAVAGQSVPPAIRDDPDAAGPTGGSGRRRRLCRGHGEGAGEIPFPAGRARDRRCRNGLVGRARSPDCPARDRLRSDLPGAEDRASLSRFAAPTGDDDLRRLAPRVRGLSRSVGDVGPSQPSGPGAARLRRSG